MLLCVCVKYPCLSYTYVGYPGEGPCKYCGQHDHSRLTSKKCQLHKQYIQATPEEQAEMRKTINRVSRKTQRNTSKSRANKTASSKRYQSTAKGCTTNAASSKRYQSTAKGCATNAACSKRYRRTANGQTLSKHYDKTNSCRHGVVRRANEATLNNPYQANRHLFAKYAAAAMAYKAAHHVNITKDDLLENNPLRPLTDDEILGIKKRWDEHMKGGCSREVCGTCGIIGLSDPTEFDMLTEQCIQAFVVVVCVCVSVSACVFLRVPASVICAGICVCVPVPACACVCLFVPACACLCLFVSVSTCACLCLRVPVCACLCLLVPACACLCRCLRVSACACMRLM
jgi:hypothetical protein